MDAAVNYTASELGRRYGCSAQNVRASAIRGAYIAPTSTTKSGAPLWEQNAVLMFESTDDGARWAARVSAEDYSPQ